MHNITENMSKYWFCFIGDTLKSNYKRYKKMTLSDFISLEINTIPLMWKCPWKSNPGGQYGLLMENWISDTESVYSNELQ